ncbi:MAG: hypothetical protein M1817_001483 [Caeruleum heppii]|nr:MAG: hypothetical protein M1817_001483 [Caeruleum heppii]
MVLRPATPLSAVLFVAFVLLLIAVISTPIVKSIKLATWDGVDFGVFGYCKGTTCSGISVGYTPSTTNEDRDFSLPASTRHSLSPLLIVHPIAALLTLVLLGLSLTAHLHAPSHSPKYLLAVLILTLPAFLLSLLAFLVDILIFQPHLGWGIWLVLAATICLAICGVITCAMRRTLVSRKARKKRIAENAEMNGENFYNQQAAASPPPSTVQPTAPLVNGAPGADKLPEFATFDLNQKADGRMSNEERIPLNSRTPSNATRNDSGFHPGTNAAFAQGGPDLYGGAPQRTGPSPGPHSRQGNGGAIDEFGNPLPASAVFGPGPGSRNDHANGYGPPPFSARGRGGYPPGGRGGYGRGPPQGGWRGPSPGMNADGRGMGPGGPGMAMGGVMGRGGHRGPPPGYNNAHAGRGGHYGRDPSPYGGGYGRRPSPGPPSAPGYARHPSPGPPPGPGGYGRRPSPGPPSAPGYAMRTSPVPHGDARAYNGPPAPVGPAMPTAAPLREEEFVSPPPPHDDGMMVGQAVEMDATTGSPSPLAQHSPDQPPGAYTHFRDSIGDSRAVGGFHSQQDGSPLRQPSGTLSPTSVYSAQDPYVPPRAAWADGGSRTGSPLNTIHEPSAPAHAQASVPVELPASGGPAASAGHARLGSTDTDYYEDVDPRFADHEQPVHAISAVPASLTPGYGHPGGHPGGQQMPPQSQGHLGVDDRPSYENLHDNSRSPAESDTSHYTSVSQRGVNPQWRPMPQQSGQMGAAPRRPGPQQQRDMLLSGNNDFELTGAGASRNGPRGGGRMPGQPPGRYPGANEI